MVKYKLLVSSLLVVSALAALLGIMPSGNKGAAGLLQKACAVLTFLGALLLVYRAFR
jgi:hypothetical protein